MSSTTPNGTASTGRLGGSNPLDVPALTDAGKSAARLAVEILRRRKEKLTRKIKPKPRTSLYASGIPDCERQGVYEFLNWKDKKMWDWKLETLFRMGNVNEDAYKAELRELGIDLVEDGAPLGDDMRSKYGIAGYLDTRIRWEGQRIPVEMKMMSTFIYDKIVGIDLADPNQEVTAELIQEGIKSMRRFPWTRKYLRQGQTYMIGTNEEALIFALTNGRGDWKFVIQMFDYEEGEKILQIAERIKKHVAAETLPDRIHYNNEICGRCPFQHICLPDIENDPKIKIENNPTVIEKIKEWERNAAKAKAWAKLDKELKELGKGNDSVIVGDFVIKDKVIQTTQYQVPKEVKKEYAKKVEQHRVTIERFLKPDPESIYLETGRQVDLEEGS